MRTLNQSPRRCRHRCRRAIVLLTLCATLAPAGARAASNAVAVAAGGLHTCAVTATGGVRCWGDNETGQLGDGTTTSRPFPADVTGLTSGVAAVTAGYQHTCALTAAGGVKCWGRNRSGELGDGTTIDRLTPVDVAGLPSGLVALAAGGAYDTGHTCAVTASGSVKCWGANYRGQLGDGTTTNRSAPTDVVGLANDVVNVVAGGQHTCVVRATGGVKCWGDNQVGQLGDGTTTSHSTPVDVVSLSSGVEAATAGELHTCALTTADGVKCWGANGEGQLGDGTTTGRLTPTDVAGLATGVLGISTGAAHTCALTTIGGVKCWGANEQGQVGDGTTTNRPTPTEVVGLPPGLTAVEAGGYRKPIVISGMLRGYTLRGHGCAVSADGSVKCWGGNDHGQVGDGTWTRARSTPEAVVGLTSGVAAIAAGGAHTCAVTTAGGVKCWGANESGQLGDATTTGRLTPVDVPGLAAGVVAVSAGGNHTCALTTNGGVTCWGANSSGQLGDGTSQSRLVPAGVVGLASGVAAISAGGAHTCALTTAGGVKCWGANAAGQLGDGTPADRDTPVDAVGLTSGVLAVDAGNSHTCALAVSGGVKCWGVNTNGELGDGTTQPRLVPTTVAGLASGAIAISAGGGHSCAVTAGGGVKCWGSNVTCQLGAGDATCVGLGSFPTPVDVVGLTGPIATVAAGGPWFNWGNWRTAPGGYTCALTPGGGEVCWGWDNSPPTNVSGLPDAVVMAAAGSQHTCAVTTGGGVSCWGSNSDGQLGDGTGPRLTPVRVLGFGPTPQYALTLWALGTGRGEIETTLPGLRVSKPGAAAAQAVGTADEAERVSLSAVAAGGSVLAGWSGDADCVDGEVTLLEATTCVATFALEPPPVIETFAPAKVLVNRGERTSVQWAVEAGATVALDGAPAATTGTLSVTPSQTMSYTLTATGPGGTTTAVATVHVNDGVQALATPMVVSPTSDQAIEVAGVTFAWTPLSGVSGYGLRIFHRTTGQAVFSGSLAGAGVTSALIAVPDGDFTFAVRGCTSDFTAAHCGAWGTVDFRVALGRPAASPQVTMPVASAVLTSSTNLFGWTVVAWAYSYQVVVTNLTTNRTAMRVTTVGESETLTILTLPSGKYGVTVEACASGCAPASELLPFEIALEAPPTDAPVVTGTTLAGNVATIAWTSVTGADLYRVELVQGPPAGPGGGALTIASRQTAATSATFPVPQGLAYVLVRACNGDGCGPVSAGTPLDVGAEVENPAAPQIGAPMSVVNVAGPVVVFSWSRVPGDLEDGRTWYRLYAQDMARAGAALDVLTTGNYYGAAFMAEGTRYDAIVTAHPGTAEAVTGPAVGFVVTGTSSPAPTMVAPAHQSQVPAGNVQLGWTPVAGATLYEYFVAVRGQPQATARGVTTGLFVQLPLTVAAEYSGVVRACPAGAACGPDSDAGWGPWSVNGGTGVTNFRVVP